MARIWLAEEREAAEENGGTDDERDGVIDAASGVLSDPYFSPASIAARARRSAQRRGRGGPVTHP